MDSRTKSSGYPYRVYQKRVRPPSIVLRIHGDFGTMFEIVQVSSLGNSKITRKLWVEYSGGP